MPFSVLKTDIGWLDPQGGTWVRDGKSWKRAECWSSGRAAEVAPPIPDEAPEGARRVA
ncbi:MAG: hypothetical protein MUF34_20090 [Polyangiaceae bacterium]|nr:hypothetical protein [Polyangiaceae bacterium]